MPLVMTREKIVDVVADAIVCDSEPIPCLDFLKNHAIYFRAGAARLYSARKKSGVLQKGQITVTPGFALRAKRVIHTVIPRMGVGDRLDKESLKKWCIDVLDSSRQHGCSSVAIPLACIKIHRHINEGTLITLLNVIRKHPDSSDMRILLVADRKVSIVLTGRLFAAINAYIGNRSIYDIGIHSQKTMLGNRLIGEHIDHILANSRTVRNATQKEIYNTGEISIAFNEKKLDEALGNVGESFQQYLLRLIDEKGYSDTEVYKRANLDRRLFSKIRKNPDYQPKKQTAFALAIALRLNYDEANDFIARAGYTFSPGSVSDIIVESFIKQGVYDILIVNLVLFDHKQPILGD